MPSRRIKPPPVRGTWTWLAKLIRDQISARGMFQAPRAETLGILESHGESRLDERLAEWCAARHLDLRIVDGMVEVRRWPRSTKGTPKGAVLACSMQEVIVRGLF